MKKFNEIQNENDFILPNYKDPNIVDLVRYLYHSHGIDFPINENMKKFKNMIPCRKHTIFILSDGTGSNLIEKLPNNHILKKNKVSDMLTVFPSTTACVLTSVVTGEYPSTHGMWGWYNYNRKENMNYSPLLFRERDTEQSLSELGIASKDIFLTPSQLNNLNCTTNVLFPKDINNSVYSKFVIDDKNRYGYENFEDILSFMEENCMNHNESYTYLYIPDIDELEHDYGVDSKVVLEKLEEISDMVTELSKIENLTIIFTADHGQVNIDKDVVMDFEQYEKYFYSKPTIDFGSAFYYIKDEWKDEFEKRFTCDFKNQMYLFDTNELIKKNIFGVGNLTEYAKSGMGEYMSICRRNYCFINSSDIEKFFQKTLGNHSGLTKEEMIIPLIIINGEEKSKRKNEI